MIKAEANIGAQYEEKTKSRLCAAAMPPAGMGSGRAWSIKGTREKGRAETLAQFPADNFFVRLEKKSVIDAD